jgi:hypothetical protein
VLGKVRDHLAHVVADGHSRATRNEGSGAQGAIGTGAVPSADVSEIDGGSSNDGVSALATCESTSGSVRGSGEIPRADSAFASVAPIGPV